MLSFSVSVLIYVSVKLSTARVVASATLSDMLSEAISLSTAASLTLIRYSLTLPYSHSTLIFISFTSPATRGGTSMVTFAPPFAEAIGVRFDMGYSMLTS